MNTANASPRRRPTLVLNLRTANPKEDEQQYCHSYQQSKSCS